MITLVDKSAVTTLTKEKRNMGMDLKGRNEGTYFRRNVWGWHPLWALCCDLHKEICNKVAHGHTNDGSGLNNLQSVALADALETDINNGKVGEYIKARNDILAAMLDEICDICDGTGIRKPILPDEVGLTPEEMKLKFQSCGGCNKCRGKGKVRPIETWYSVDKNDVVEFVEFLRECGGFEIW